MRLPPGRHAHHAHGEGIAVGAAITSLGSPFHNAATNHGVNFHFFDRLVNRKSTTSPALAVSWAGRNLGIQAATGRHVA